MPFKDAEGREWNAATPLAPPDIAELTTNYYVRQNPYKTDTYGLYTICATSKKLNIPFTSTKDDCNRYLANPQEYLRTCNDKSRLLMNLPVGTLITVVGKHEAKIVKITSDVKAGHCSPVYVVRNPAVYDGLYTEQTQEQYINSIVHFVVPTDDYSTKIINALKKGYLIEPFYSLYRDFEFVCRVECDDMRQIGGVASSGARTSHYYHYEPDFAPGV
jgi:hypothetical protein